MLQIIKNIRNSFFILILICPNVFAKEITNLSWNKSVYVGKKLSNFRETVKSPALGKEAWKIIAKIPNLFLRQWEMDKECHHVE